jgi:two-component system heavy metal sensor histidine kinase CusS
MLIVFAVAVFWAVLVATWVVGRLTRGHEAIAAAARSVAGGDLSARVAVPRGTDEVSRLASDVNRMIEQLSGLVASQREFIAHAAHELRSPLTTLYGELQLALRRERDADGYRGAIEEALDSATRLKTLAEDLLALARIGSTVADSGELVSPRTAVEEAVRTVASEAQARDVRLAIDGDARVVSGRPQDLERLFRNLVENAVRHSPPGAAVEVRLRDTNEHVVVTVSDEGRGVPDGDRERIFEPFFRGAHESVNDVPGVGLGLAIARKIASAHGGALELGPARDRGAQFVVRLPALG